MVPSLTTLLLIGFTLLALWSSLLTYLLIKQNAFFRIFTAGIAKNDLKTILKNLAVSLKRIGAEINRLDTQANGIIKDNHTHLQKVGFVRYNPFSDTGGDQSFCLCLLDQNNTGLVLTSLHSREQTRIYAKTVSRGETKGYEFSKEEKEAIDMACKRKKS